MTLPSKNESPTLVSAPASAGLENVVAAETVLSHVDGAAGRLVIRGYELEQLADWSFEAALALLWEGFAAPDLGEADIRAALARCRLHAFKAVERLMPVVDQMTQVEGLRLLLSTLTDNEQEPHHVMAVASVPVFTAAIARRHAGLKPVAPDATLGQAADFLQMLHGKPVEAEKVRALDTYLVTVADHGLNASTFAARVIASTNAGTFSSVIGALCALKGPLHGGAPGPVLDMLDAIGDECNARSWLVGALSRGERLMGFGHRIYRVRDPRADVLKQAVSRLNDGGGRIRFAEVVEKHALELLAEKKPLRPLQTNVEFFTALVLEAVGFSRESFTNVFAAGRMAGWTAHVLEQDRVGKLIRPQSTYVGSMPV